MGVTLNELAIAKADKQPHLVENLTEEAPIIKRLPFEEASHDLFNVAEEVTDVTGAGWVEMNAPLPIVDAASKLTKVDLAIMGGEIECPEDTANLFGGHAAYFAKKLPKVVRKSGQTAEKRIIYDNFRQYAIDNKNAVSAGGADDKCYSILAVRYVEGETGGLYSRKCFAGSGTLLDMLPINNGGLYKGQTGKYQNVLVYGMRLKAYLGVQLLNPKTVGAIVNINGGNVPTETMIDTLLADVRATPGSTFLFMHEKCKTLLNQYKGKSLQMVGGDKDINRIITHWNGVEIVTSYNFLDATEGTVVLP